MKIDPNREHLSGTGIYVRAQSTSGRWVSADIITLDKPSLLEWLRSRGGNNRQAEDTVGILLGHGHLHTAEQEGDG